MTAPIATATMPAAPNARAKLKQASQEMEALFYGQLLQSMRAALPKGGAVSASTGEEMFTSMLDDKIAGLAAARSTHGVGDALYRQMSAHLPQDSSAASKGASSANPR